LVSKPRCNGLLLQIVYVSLMPWVLRSCCVANMKTLFNICPYCNNKLHYDIQACSLLHRLTDCCYHACTHTCTLKWIKVLTTCIVPVYSYVVGGMYIMYTFPEQKASCWHSVRDNICYAATCTSILHDQMIPYKMK